MCGTKEPEQTGFSDACAEISCSASQTSCAGDSLGDLLTIQIPSLVPGARDSASLTESCFMLML